MLLAATSKQCVCQFRHLGVVILRTPADYTAFSRGVEDFRKGVG
jgi:hypothetical protein